MLYPIETTSLRPRSSIILIPFAILTAAMAFTYVQDSDKKEINIAFLVTVLITALIWVGFKKIELTINNDGLTYKTIFTTKEILWQDVLRTHIKYEHHGKSGNVYWLFETHARNLKFSTSLFGRKSLRTIAEAVVSKCHRSVIDEKIFKMSEGRFPWYIF